MLLKFLTQFPELLGVYQQTQLKKGQKYIYYWLDRLKTWSSIWLSPQWHRKWIICYGGGGLHTHRFHWSKRGLSPQVYASSNNSTLFWKKSLIFISLLFYIQAGSLCTWRGIIISTIFRIFLIIMKVYSTVHSKVQYSSVKHSV